MKFMTTHHRTGPETTSRKVAHPALPVLFAVRSWWSVVKSLKSGGSMKDVDALTRLNSVSISRRSMPAYEIPAASSARFISAMDGRGIVGASLLHKSGARSSAPSWSLGGAVVR